MKYVKSCLIVTMLLGVGYSQCDFSGDGEINILDIVGMANCILTVDCFDGSQCDWNDDGDLNILDIIETIICILDGCEHTSI